MKISKQAKKLARELNLSEVDAYLMELKTNLYESAAKLIYESELTHEEIANLMGTSRARISRISKMGENNISIELLIKLVSTLQNKAPLLWVA